MQYFVAKFEPRGDEKDIFRIIADQDGTDVETEPQVPGLPTTLAAGEFVEFEAASAFEVTASSPVAVIQYMSGSEYTGNVISGIGDPAMLVVVPEVQFVEEFIFLTPEGYLEDWITIVAPTHVEVYLDDVAVVDDVWTPFPSGDMQWAWLEVEPGVHQLRSNVPMGLTVYGYDTDVSYAYPGGAILTPQTQG